MAYPEQLRVKTEIVRRLVHAAVPGAPPVQPMRAATPLDDPWHYRHKAHFAFATQAGTVTMGHYERGSRRVMPARECPVHAERGNEVAFGLLNAYARLPVSRATSTLKSVAVRVSHARGETMATLVVASDADKRLRSATRQALGASWAPSSFHVNIHPRGDAFIFGPETRRIAGTGRLREDVAGVSFLISPTAFFQTNIKAAEMLVQLVLDAVPTSAPVLDLYAGAGLFALPLARRGHRVIAVEASPAAVADGVASLALNRIPADRCRFIARPVGVVTRRGATGRLGCTGSDLDSSPKESFTDPNTQESRSDPGAAVVLDPPREGCEAEVLDDVFGRSAPATAVYVSCNPDTLARDLTRIVGHGYAIESIQPVDMFPHTPHIETVVVLRRTRNPEPGTRNPELGTRNSKSVATRTPPSRSRAPR
jgi:23S rRNA (uracil1939-C5)-methyltransferase